MKRYIATIVIQVHGSVNLHHAQADANSLAEAIGIFTIAGQTISNIGAISVKATALDELDVITDPKAVGLKQDSR